MRFLLIPFEAVKNIEGGNKFCNQWSTKGISKTLFSVMGKGPMQNFTYA